MNCFPDTSFLCSLYRQQVHSPKAIGWMNNRSGPLPVSAFLLLEFRQSTRLQVKLRSVDKTKGFGPDEAVQLLRDLDSDLRTDVLKPCPVDWAVVHQLAEDLSTRFTASGGHRLTDILHIATALHLGQTEFLTFDANQRRLATAAGLKVVV
ncbi:MAG: type II toxin-antitoxin system VapC family toxin [Pirellulaceae bacterium]|nr:type II toxin-antitoxin system VapC family toxin [Pirellulaceae bacterium]